MDSFRVRQGSIPLFGVVEADDPESFHAAFSDPTWSEATWEISEDILDLIAVEFDEDLDGSSSELRRYCNGKFRSKTRGPSGNRLGTIGEALAWLAFDGPKGRLIRVVDWKPTLGKVVKGVRYLQPDFIERVGGVDGVVEVKSTEQLRYRRMVQANKWQQIVACAGVYACRQEAMEQIGFSGGPTPVHSLVLTGGEVIPFPAARGSAIAVLARDGRVESLRGDDRFRTPPTCRGATPSRDCWRCLSPNGTANDVTLVRMDNAPGHLPVIGSGERSGAWAAAYFGWARALWSRDEELVGRAANELARAVEHWVDDVLPEGVDPLPIITFWGSYLHDGARQRGLGGSAGEPVLPSLADWAGGESWSPVRPAEARATLVGLNQLYGAGRPSDLEQIHRLRVSLPEGRGSLVVDADATTCQCRALDADAEFGRHITVEVASVLAAKAAAGALVAGGWLDASALQDPSLRVPLRAVQARLGDHVTHLGWVPRWPEPDADGGWHEVRAWWHHVRPRIWHPFPPGWGMPLEPGPRLRLRVTTSGRATATCDRVRPRTGVSA